MFNRFFVLILVVLFGSFQFSENVYADSSNEVRYENSYVYNVTEPFTLNGVMISDSEELEWVLAQHPGIVIVEVNKNIDFIEDFVKGDMRWAGYTVLERAESEDEIILTFQSDSEEFFETQGSLGFSMYRRACKKVSEYNYY